MMFKRSGETERREKERAQKRRGLIVFGKRRKEDVGVLDQNADQESCTRIRKNALRTVPRKAVEKATSKRGLSYWLGAETIECLI
ncbi:uncharacterized protein TNCV_4300691 [Trichonephila clavipes]|nr:uncharacterized protein TNCV_4300691 [Trichonephila clavipes]